MKKEPKKSRLRLFLFFCLETKEPKVQDWIFLLKIAIISKKIPRTRAETLWVLMYLIHCRHSNNGDFYSGLVEGSVKEIISIFFNAKISEVGVFKLKRVEN